MSSQIKPIKKEDAADVYSGPLYRLLLNLRNEIAQVDFKVLKYATKFVQLQNRMILSFVFG